MCTYRTEYWHTPISQALQPQVQFLTGSIREEFSPEERQRPKPNCLTPYCNEPTSLESTLNEAEPMEGALGDWRRNPALERAFLTRRLIGLNIGVSHGSRRNVSPNGLVVVKKIWPSCRVTRAISCIASSACSSQGITPTASTRSKDSSGKARE